METITATVRDLADAETELSGRSISPGLGMGQAWVIGDALQWSGPPAPIGKDDVAGELARLAQSVEETLAELDQSAQRIEAEFDATLAGIFRVHGQMLRELLASGEFERELRASLLSAEAVVGRVLQRWYRKFATLESQTLRQRADDVLDLGRTVIRRLRGEQDAGIKAIPEGSILVVQRLLPSDVVLLPRANVAAVVVESLGQGSHAALLAREKGIPTITDIPDLLLRIASGMELLVDGFRGTLVACPTPATRSEFEERMAKWRTSRVRCKAACRDPARTLDGQLVRVEANIGIYDDATMALDNGADGVGLLRIEQLYFARPRPPTEDELLRELESLIAPLGNRPVTIRLLDVGGDKPLPYLALPPTSNPGLGRRGVRLLLDYTQLARTQMGAILSLSRNHSLRVLIPMVTLEDDIRRMREAFDALSTERKVAERPEFGAMVETPAAALSMRSLLKYVDFFCVGSNDLTQYTLAAARDDASVNDYYLDGHESVMRLLRIMVSDAGNRPLTLCGELAAREAFVPELLRMGFRALSVAPTMIPPTKALIRTLHANGSAG
jgi:phosphoenolpyruvate-protein phosphotransferase